MILDHHVDAKWYYAKLNEWCTIQVFELHRNVASLSADSKIQIIDIGVKTEVPSYKSITKEDLSAWLEKFSLKPIDGAKVLRINKSKMSEYLSGERAVPPYIAAHVETFNQLSAESAKNIISKTFS